MDESGGDGDDVEITGGHVWVCPACGREHPKNSPPCSRCGNMRLERRAMAERDFSDELDGGGWLSVLDAKYVLGYLVAGLAITVLALGVLGVIYVPGIGQPPVPSVDDVPGSAETGYGQNLTQVEAAYRTELNQRREAAGYRQVRGVAQLDAVATYVTQRAVTARAGTGERVPDDEVPRLLREECDVGLRWDTVVVGDNDVDGAFSAAVGPADVAAALVEQYVAETGRLVAAPRGKVGVDVHALPDDGLVVTQITC